MVDILYPPSSFLSSLLSLHSLVFGNAIYHASSALERNDCLLYSAKLSYSSHRNLNSKAAILMYVNLRFPLGMHLGFPYEGFPYYVLYSI